MNEENEKPSFEKKLEGSSSTSGRLVARKISKDGTEAIRVADDQGRSSAADVDDKGNIQTSIKGPSPRGEEGALNACALLIERLNLEGSNWSKPSRPVGNDRGIDCESADGEKKLQIQVTRLNDSAMWAALARDGSVKRPNTIDSAADDLRRAISHKEDIPSSIRSEVTLAIDAIDTSAHIVQTVAEQFKKKYGSDVGSLGFHSIWVVGPVVRLVFRLDTL